MFDKLNSRYSAAYFETPSHFFFFVVNTACLKELWKKLSFKLWKMNSSLKSNKTKQND